MCGVRTVEVRPQFHSLFTPSLWVTLTNPLAYATVNSAEAGGGAARVPVPHPAAQHRPAVGRCPTSLLLHVGGDHLARGTLVASYLYTRSSPSVYLSFCPLHVCALELTEETCFIGAKTRRGGAQSQKLLEVRVPTFQMVTSNEGGEGPRALGQSFIH